MTSSEDAWLAGLLEGEGCFLLKGPTSGYVSLSMTDEDVVRRAALVAGVGSVRKERLRENRKQVWTWRIGARDDVIHVISRVRKHMGARRGARIDQMLESYRNNPRIRAIKGQVPHGIRAKYAQGCRCSRCRAAEAAYQADLKDRRNNDQVGKKGVARSPYAERIVK